MAKILKVDGSVIDVEPKNGTDFELQELHDIVDGYIEIVRLNNEQIMVVNEEGKLYGLDFNANATNIMRNNIATNDYVVGDALICDNSQVK